MAEKKFFGGAAWKENLTHVHYVDGKITSRSEHYGKSTVTTVLTNELANAVIIHLSAFSIKLPQVKWKTVADNLLVHQFAVGESKTGHLITLEKTATCILMQTCHSADTPFDVLIRLRDGEERKLFETMKTIVTDRQPKDKTVKDIIEWIFESGELTEKYNLFDSNCQQFVMNLWQRFASDPFPNPSKALQTHPLAYQQQVNVAKVKKKEEIRVGLSQDLYLPH